MEAGKQWRRGFNQSELIARSMARLTGIPYARTLAEVASSGTQKTLSLTDRFINTIGRYGVIGPSLAGKTVLIVDDVLTTGATINECARVLRDAGCSDVYALVLARVNVAGGAIKK
jgi:ComF family protein